MKKRILVVLSYPIKTPQHGGQKRAAAVVEEYERSGNVVFPQAIYMDDFYAEALSTDIAIEWDQYKNRLYAGYISDLILGDAFLESEISIRKFIQNVRTFSPDIVHFEQMFLYDSVKKILHDIGWKGKVVYGSQNIEYELKQSILLSNGSDLNADDTQKIVDQVKLLELKIVHDADLVLACTESDAAKLKEMGAGQVVLAPNGISQGILNESEAANWKILFSKQYVSKLIVFVGSAHPPNLTGFMRIIGMKVGFLEADTRLLLLGGVSDLIMGEVNLSPNYLKTIFLERVVPMGRVSDDALSALLELAHMVILPITEGGGSNLKTAEAILADKFIVGTEKAFHSYEAYCHLPNNIITDDPEAFRFAIDSQLRLKKQKRNEEERTLSRGVLWENTLRVMVTKVEGL